jgi:UDP-N-acetylmuramoyl-tripeptide--D-alanyl-D-alanine ligase
VIGRWAGAVAASAVESGLAPERVFVARDHDQLIGRVLDSVRDGDVVLVKGSRGMALEKVVQALELKAAGGSLQGQDSRKGH